MHTIRDLDPVEVRVLGALLEKEQTTPEYYPLTVNALLAAANQKSGRDPVTALSEEEVLDALDRLRQDVLAWRSEGARVERWSQSISRRLEIDRKAKALLTVLMLRGPQTAGELRSRCARMQVFDDLAEVETTLEGLAAGERPLVTELPRSPGQKERRWMHLLGGPVEFAEPAETADGAGRAAAGPTLAGRVADLEAEVASLRDELAALRRRLGDGPD